MSLRKFGTADDHQVAIDQEDEQGVSSSQIRRIASTTDDAKEREELLRETNES